MNLASWGEGKRETLILAYNEMKKLILKNGIGILAHRG